MEENYTIWTERYRPKEFDDVFGHDDIVKRLKSFVSQKNMPHMLFAGFPGSGKTTLALIVAKKLFGDSWHNNFLELNASDERGIEVVRQKVKAFARTRALSDAPFKLIFLDESDALTKEAQQALRRTMEMYTNTCRFILSCNLSSKIIDPIQSRCAVFRFKSLEKEDVKKYIEKIAKDEKLKIDDKAAEAIYDITKGDLRRTANILQSCATLDTKITEDLVYEIVSKAKPTDVSNIIDLALKGKFLDARNKMLDTMLNGVGGVDLIKAIQQEVWSLKINEESKLKIIEKCGDVEFHLVEGSDEFIQLEALLASMSLYGK
ncbi:replication factor C small subunit [Candidatus Pacearchaeota archaeon]|nr:replication factor C small subunit [Candidatus Pacearchaeota archaeon]